MIIRHIISSGIRLGFVMVALACALGFVDNIILKKADKPLCIQSELPEGELCMSTLQREWGDRIVWIDTRHDKDYMTNHLVFADDRMFRIQSGVSTQEQFDAALARLIEAGESDECIVVFCKPGCDSAQVVAQHLRKEQALFDAPVFVLSRGWEALLDAGIAEK